MNSKDINRRDFITQAAKTTALATAGMSLLPESAASAASKMDDLNKYDFLMPRVKFACDKRVQATWNTYPGADKNLLQGLSSVVRCKIKLPTGCNNSQPIYGTNDQFNAVVDLTDLTQLRKHPFLFMTAEGHYVLTDRKKQNLKDYIEGGGFLLMDDCVYAGTGDYFYQSSHKILEELFGPDSVKPIPMDHEVFHNIYDFGDIGVPYIQGQDHGAIGLFVKGRLAVFLNATDLHCGWANIMGSQKYKKSIEMGINIIMYAISH